MTIPKNRGTRLILSLWRQQKARFYCISTKTAAGKWKDYFFEKHDFGDVQDFLDDHEGENIYFCPHGFKTRARQKEEAVLPMMCWADLDEVDPRKLGKLKPTIAIESSPGRYVGLWLLDRTVTELLNKRLSYQTGADKGGWDVTQVLRFPGTINFKYKSRPQVRVMWSDGDEFEFAKIDRLCADLDAEDEETGQTAGEIYARYSKKMKPAIKRDIMSPTITRGSDRSLVIWKLIKELIEVGMDEDEAFIVMRNTIWIKDKYDAAGRNPDKPLRQQIAKAIREKLSGPKADRLDKLSREEDEEEDDDDAPKPIELTPISGVKRDKVQWLWDRRIALGELTILEGHPSAGKSYLSMMIGGMIVDGDRFPNERPSGHPPRKGAVLYFDLENDAGTVTKPRLEDNKFQNLDQFIHVRRLLSIDDEEDYKLIRDAITRLKPKLVVFDTLNYFIGGADVHNSKEAQQALLLFANLAKEFGCAVIVLRHLRKGSANDASSAMEMGMGSMAFAAVARTILGVTKAGDPDLREDGWRAVSVVKTNIGAPAKGILFRINEEKGDASRFEFGDFCDESADEILQQLRKAPGKKDKDDGAKEAADSARTEAEKLLRKYLSGGKIADGDFLRRRAERASIDLDTLNRVANKIGVEKNKRDEWRLK